MAYERLTLERAAEQADADRLATYAFSADAKHVRVAELRYLVFAAGLTCNSKHTKAELLAILASGYVAQAAAICRAAAKRRTTRVAKRHVSVAEVMLAA